MNTVAKPLEEMAALRQVVHMDQGVAYSPEYRATRAMSDYPSRKIQVARALSLGQLEPSNRSVSILRNHILSRQGERWQNFGEDPEEFTSALIEARRFLREISLSDGMKPQLVRDHTTLSWTPGPWNDTLPCDEKSTTSLLLTPASWENLAASAESLGRILRSASVSVRPLVGPIPTGWAYFAHGFVDEGVEHLKQQLLQFQKVGVRRLITTCGESTYVWRHLAQQYGVHHDLEVVDVLELMRPLGSPTRERIFVYGGSFYVRYLMHGPLLNSLFPVSDPKPVRHSEERLKLYNTSMGRVNEVTIWQRPLSPEFPTYKTIPEDTLTRIYQDALADYLHAPDSVLVIANPYALHNVRTRNPEIPAAYIWDMWRGPE